MYRSREVLEEIEAQTLAPYALLSKNSRPREYQRSISDPPGKFRNRTAFQLDRDRIIHSAAFRRLEYKTQVFENDASEDYYRTRLTHTLEVAQIGRNIAHSLGVNEDLVEAICLAHDLGHPPFGHVGEDVLDEIVRNVGGEGFNHNVQSYRIVTKLEKRYPEWDGLNLTPETLEGISKHKTTDDSMMSEVAGTDQEQRGSVEAQIADLADSMAYNAHDLDDGLKSGLINEWQLDQLEIWHELCQRTGWAGGMLSSVDRHRMISELISYTIEDVVINSSQILDSVGFDSPQQVQQYHQDVVRYTDHAFQMYLELQQFLQQNMYQHYRILRMRHRSEWMLRSLFNSLVENPRLLPPEYQAHLAERKTYRVVADYIASMTDRSALLEYRQLFDPRLRP